jgi:hypothetical protein
VVGWIQASRGDDKTYASESRAVRLPAGGDNPVATAASSGKEVALEDPGASSTFKRAGLAKEFNVATLRCVPCAGGGVLEYGIPRQQALPKPAPAVAALLKMRCETSGSGYAIFWQQGTGGLAVAGGYVSPARKAELEAEGKTGTFVDACAGVVLDAGGENPVARALASGAPVYIEDVAGSESFARKDKAAEYGITSICFMPAMGGVVEYGSGKAGWEEGMRNAATPAAELAAAFNAGASFAIFWKQEGEEMVAAADFVLPERVAALKVSG